ncbi:MAG: hypothetical protein WCJ72_12720, partial [Chryseobacterium sp.]
VASALRQYFSFMGIPKMLLSDNDPSFRGEVSALLQTYNITHSTSYPYAQRGNSVEAQVRKFLNACRSTIIENPIAKHTEWHTLYPLIIVRINTLISKYGLSREYVHFHEISDSHLPTILDLQFEDDFRKDLSHLSHVFRGKIQKFLRNKEKAKQYYKKTEKCSFYLHELVMRKDYNPNSPLQPTYVGPYRIIELFPQGALLKCPRLGEMLSVHYMNLRKISIDEFIALLPTNFDSDILKTIQNYRYARKGNPEKFALLEKEEKETENEEITISERKNALPDTSHFSNRDSRILRSGRSISINVHTLPTKYIGERAAHWQLSDHPVVTSDSVHIPKLLSTLQVPRTCWATFDQEPVQGLYLFHNSIEEKIPTIQPEPNYKTRYKSSFASTIKGILTIRLRNESNHARKVRFSHLEIKFY